MSHRYKIMIPARAGSKRIERKNTVLLAGLPLIEHCLISAKKADVGEVWVSTNDPTVTDICQRMQVHSLQRPEELCQDESPTEAAVSHFLEFLTDQGSLPDALILLQPTSPMLLSDDIRRATALYEGGSFDSLFSGFNLIDHDMLLWCRSSREGLMVAANYNSNVVYGRYRDQRDENWWIENGALYLFNVDKFMRLRNRLFGSIGVVRMPFWRSLEVDTPDDLLLIEGVLHARAHQP